MVISADDFGMTEGINRACVELYLQGMLDCVSVMVNQQYTDEAIKLINKYNIKCGLHFNITQGKSLTGYIKNLTNEQGEFLGKKNIDINNVDKYSITREFIAQYDFLSSNGVDISFVDCHHNINFNLIDMFLINMIEEFGLVIRNVNNCKQIDEISNCDKNIDVVYCHPAYLDELLFQLSPNYYGKRIMEYVYLMNGGYDIINEIHNKTLQ